MLNILHTPCLLLGRFLLGIYFILPGIQKIIDYEGMSAYMLAHEVPFISFLLPLTIILQISAGTALIVGYKGQVSAFILAGLTFVISLYMHDFWNMEDGVARMHEMQNFVKNMAILAGLLIIAAQGTGKLSVDLNPTSKTN